MHDPIPFNDPDYLMTEGQTSEFTNIAVKTLRNWRLAGTGPKFAKLGMLVRYRRRDVLDWVERHLASSTTDAGR
jgi:predicted DNA-binding transcriptional regulator AlpA